MKTRLDQALVKRGLVSTRSQAESYTKLGQVKVNGAVVTKPGYAVDETSKISMTAKDQYVSRAALKLASVAQSLNLDFKGKTVLDVGSSTGGFTDYALRHGAKKVIAVDTGTNQLHPSLRTNPAIELHEKTDIRNVRLQRTVASNMGYAVRTTINSARTTLATVPDIVLLDVSFISLRKILPTIFNLSRPGSLIVAMVKPQFETANAKLKNKGVIKNEQMRRKVLRDFELWVQSLFKIIHKADSKVTGEKGNRERFYLLTKLTNYNTSTGQTG